MQISLRKLITSAPIGSRLAKSKSQMLISLTLLPPTAP